MTRYAYYPGCSLDAVGKPYDLSLRAVFGRLGLELQDVTDWNCCGATAYAAVDETTALTLAARNLSLAEAQHPGTDMVAPCSACYLVLRKTHRLLAEHAGLKADVDRVLAEGGGRPYQGGVTVRHPLDVLVNDVGLDAIAKRVVRPLTGARVAPYYGCQMVRPEGAGDDREHPMWLDDLFRRAGAEVIDFSMKVRCCGGMLMTTAEPVGRRLAADILAAAVDEGANVVVTTCPLCQVNLELFQGTLGKFAGRPLHMPVAYFTQLLGLALGASEREVGLPLNVVPLRGVLAPPRREALHV
jgi:heterodisulfide reductase subunit B